MLLAFNVSVKKELEQRLSREGLDQGKVMTLHGFGLLALRRVKRVHINKNKNFLISKRLRELNPNIFRRLPWKDQLRLSYTLMDMNDVSRLFLTEDVIEIKKHFANMGKAFYEHPDIRLIWSKFIEIREEYYNAEVVYIDFLDMLYLPVIKNLDIPLSPTYLMIDEAQDLSLIQHKLINKIKESEHLEKWIAVGDKNQSIYGFSGAYSDSFMEFLNKDNVEEKTLSTCYRCAKGIIDSSNLVYDVMQPFKEDEGVVGVITDIDLVEQIEGPAMIVCRNTAPLVSMYFFLLSKGKNCYIEGEEILNGVKNILRPYNSRSLAYAKAELATELMKLSRDTSENGRIALHVFEENYAIFKEASEALLKGVGSVRDLLSAIESLSSNKGPNSIMLCTIHKSKGLEADTVFILREDLIPSKFAKTREQLTQEQNLKYVARTRAKKNLFFINIKDF